MMIIKELLLKILSYLNVTQYIIFTMSTKHYYTAIPNVTLKLTMGTVDQNDSILEDYINIEDDLLKSPKLNFVFSKNLIYNAFAEYHSAKINYICDMIKIAPLPNMIELLNSLIDNSFSQQNITKLIKDHKLRFCTSISDKYRMFGVVLLIRKNIIRHIF